MKYSLASLVLILFSTIASAQIQVDKKIQFSGSGSNAKIEGIDEITNNKDAVNKIYVDTAIANRASTSNSGGLVSAKPFIYRHAIGSTSNLSWTTVATIAPLTAGNYLTITNLKLEAFRPSCCCANVHFVITYADGTSYTSTDYGCPGTSYTTMADVSMPVNSSVSGTIASIAVEAIMNSSGGSVTARLSVSGFESTASTNAIKPFISRSATASTTNTSFTTMLTITPLTSGNYLTITNVKLEGFRPSCCCADFRFKMDYADGTSYTSSNFGCPGTSYTTMIDVALPVYSNVKGNITAISVEGQANSGGSLNARLTISGYENAP